jgi:hypothetical protein
MASSLQIPWDRVSAEARVPQGHVAPQLQPVQGTAEGINGACKFCGLQDTPGVPSVIGIANPWKSSVRATRFASGVDED